MSSISEEEDCPVCASQMTVKKFEAQQHDDIIPNTDCLRLKCGHAFHAACILEGFRRGTGCPVCRTSLVEQTQSQTQGDGSDGVRFVLDLQTMQISVQEESDSETEITENPVANALLVSVQQQRSINPDVRAARTLLKKSIKEYKESRQFLIQERAKRIQKALREFRRDLRSVHYSALKQVREKVRKVKKAEKKALLEKGVSEDDAEEFFRVFEEQFDTQTILFYKTDDPCSRRFWAH